MLKRSVRDWWVKALRSDDFTQGQSGLASRDVRDGPVRHCCLGVLSEGAIEHGVNIARSEDRGELSYDSCVSYPPNKVREWAGLPLVEDEEAYGVNVTLPNGAEVNLAHLNDLGMPFAQIADYLDMCEVEDD